MPETAPGFYRHTDPSGDTLDISPALSEIDGRTVPVAALALDIAAGLGITIHIPPTEVEKVVAAIRTAAGSNPDPEDLEEPDGEDDSGPDQPAAPRCDVTFGTGERCARPADHRTTEIASLCMPTETLRLHERRARWQAAARKAKVPVDSAAIRAYMAVADEEQRVAAAVNS
ncbi:hypothetical protein [Streptomyces liangshanensis]|uniref:hypothetical protein n=1 Tax=Streptomyces liangshanensis TaxID=2717324 RepID=UPI0036D85F23